MADLLHARLAALSRRVGGPLLSIDTSSALASLALVSGEAATPSVREMTLSARALPSEGLLEAMVSLLQQAHVAPRSLKALSVGLGPGSFTGLRVGLASVKGLALSMGTPVYGFVSSLACALGTGPGRTWVIGDARRQSVHLLGVEVGDDGQARIVSELACLSYAEAHAQIASQQADPDSVRLVGDGVRLVCEHASAPLGRRVEASVSAAWGLFSLEERVAHGRADELSALAPLYLQEMALPPSAMMPPV